MRRAFAPLAILACVLLSSVAADADPPVPGRTDIVQTVSMRPRIELVDDSDASLQAFAQGGRRFVLGEAGQRYRIRIVNPTGGRVEAVVSVDGLDAIDGRTATTSKRGYLVPAHGEIVVDGWRTSMATVAAFRFSTVPESYAGLTGHEQNIGVIGAAFFREQPPPPPPRVVWHGLPTPSAAPRSAAGAGGGASPAARPGQGTGPNEDAARPGLGTQFGESHESHIQEVEFQRADARPMAMSELRYDDRAGLLARGIHLPPRDEREAENDRRDQAQPFADTRRFAQPPR